jgi:hypothetical protein
MKLTLANGRWKLNGNITSDETISNTHRPGFGSGSLQENNKSHFRNGQYLLISKKWIPVCFFSWIVEKWNSTIKNPQPNQEERSGSESPKLLARLSDGLCEQDLWSVFHARFSSWICYCQDPVLLWCGTSGRERSRRETWDGAMRLR